MNIVEKILARASGKETVSPDDVVFANMDKVMVHDVSGPGVIKVFDKLKKKGVKIRIAAPLNKETKGALKEVSKVAEVKNLDAKARFCVVDGKEIIMMILDDKEVHPTYDAGLWVNSPFFGNALENLFNIAWKSSK